MRIELLESRAPLDAEIVLDAQRSRAIDDELAARRASLAHELAERYRASLYR
jgi:hypothetical protein